MVCGRDFQAKANGRICGPLCCGVRQKQWQATAKANNPPQYSPQFDKTCVKCGASFKGYANWVPCVECRK
jgi:hypothetical protein